MFTMLSDLVSDVDSFVDAHSETLVTPDGSILFLLNNDYALMSVSDLRAVYEYGNRRINYEGYIHVNYKGEDVLVDVTDKIRGYL